jgi:murein DD-endopeptidase MepM/ murein hydrolase activator NlpD
MKFLKPFKCASLNNVTQGFNATHRAIDWLPSRKAGFGGYGTPLVAPEDGIVHTVYTINNPKEDDDGKLITNGFGLWIIGDSGRDHLIWHTQPVMPVSLNDRVKRGQIVAYCGDSGNVFENGVYVPIEQRNIPNFLGTHLHQMMTDIGEGKGSPVDPLPLIDFDTEPSYTIFDELKAISITLLKISKLL